MRLLGVIPARKGSKGVPRKNIALLDGKPLILHTVSPADRAIASGILSRVVVSTDDEELTEIVNKHHPSIPCHRRPDNLASDTAKTIDVVLNVLETEWQLGNRFDAIVLLQPTSPLRTFDDIDQSVRLFTQSSSNSLISCYREESITPTILYVRSGERAIPLCVAHAHGGRRQDEQSVLVRNGAIYISKVHFLVNERRFIEDEPLIYEMPKDRSANIDRPSDLEKASLSIQRARTTENT